MAPGDRANTQSRRANRTYVDHDVFEGLPVRNWRRDTVTVAPPEMHEIATQKDKWDIELPYGMPKDSQLLPQHSQDLLRAARSGKLYAKRAPFEEEEVDVEATLGDKPEKKEDPKEKGFAVKTWKPAPRHLEGPEIDYLAKRRKGLTGSVVKPGVTSGPIMTKTKVRRTDAAGNTYVEDVVVPEGQAVEGEVISQTVITDPATTGVQVDGLNGPPVAPRRRPPPPKRKAKGPGRGRRRKLPLPPTSVPGELATVKTEGQTQASRTQESIPGPDGIKLDISTPTANENENEDTEIGDGSIIPSDEEGEDGEEGGSDDDDDQEGEGENERDVDDQDDELEHPASDINHEGDEITRTLGQEMVNDTPSSPDIPLAASSSHQHEFSGSPLKKVITPPQYATSFENSNLDLSGDEEAEGDLDDGVENVHGEMGNGMHNESIESSYPMAHVMSLENPTGVVSFEQQEAGVGPDGHMMAMHHHLEEYDTEDEMLLDGDDDEVVLGSMSFPSTMVEEEENATSMHTLVQLHEAVPQAMGTVTMHSLMETAGGTENEDEDEFEDLLGSLEDHLNDQAPETTQNEELVVEHVTMASAPATEVVEEPLVKDDGVETAMTAEGSATDEGESSKGQAHMDSIVDKPGELPTTNQGGGEA